MVHIRLKKSHAKTTFTFDGAMPKIVEKNQTNRTGNKKWLAS